MIIVNELELTKLLVYGTTSPGPDPNTHIRPNNTSSAPPPLMLSMSDYLTTGAGRYAKPSEVPLIKAFFSDAASATPVLANKTYTVATLVTALGLTPLPELLRFNVSQYTTDPSSSDFIERAYVFGSTSFEIFNTVTFTVNSGTYTVNNLEVLARQDNFDFQSSNPIAATANVLLNQAFDPYGLIPVVGSNTVPVDIIYTGTGRKYSTYTLANFDDDQELVDGWTSPLNFPIAAANFAGALAGLATNTGYLGSINSDLRFRYYTADGKKIVYGTPDDDNLTVLSAELTLDLYFDYQMVGGDGNDQITGGSFGDELWGGNGNDQITGGIFGDDTFIGGQGNDILDGGFGEDISIYSDVVENYDFSISDDGETVTITHARGIQADGTDTLTNVEFGQFSDRKVQLLGNTLSFVNDFVVGTTQDTQVIFELTREGDTSFPLTVFVDGEVTTGNAVFNDFTFTFEAGSSPSLIIGASVSEAFGDVAFSFEISTEDENPLSGLILIEDDDASGLLIGDQVDDRGGRTFGDPHLITFDNLAYDFQASGDFVLARATDGAEYEVQARFVALSSAVSVTEAMATSVDGIAISLEANGSEGSVLIDGQATTIADGDSLTVGTGSISRTGQTYDIDYGNGDSTFIDVFDSFINVTPSPSLSRTRGEIEGLLGNANGNPIDDFQLADGTVLQTPLSSEALYGDYAASWLVDENTSLLPGLPEQYVAPLRIITVDSLPETLRLSAEVAVDAVGINNPVIREAAILDFALTGNEEFIEAAKLTDNDFDPIVGTVAVDPVINPAVILTSDRLELDEEDASARSATLSVARGSAEGNLKVNYSIQGVGAEPADADDFLDSLITGEIVIQDGSEIATFNIQIEDDLLVEGIETFDVSIALEDDQASSYEVLVSSLRFSINDADESTTPNIIDGTSGRDNLTGSNEDDLINGGQGRDAITTGGGEDILVYTSIVDAGDLISDFEVGTDKFDFSQLLDSFNYGGSNPFADGYVAVTNGRNSSVITVDTDGALGAGRARQFILVENTTVEALNNAENFIF